MLTLAHLHMYDVTIKRHTDTDTAPSCIMLSPRQRYASIEPTVASFSMGVVVGITLGLTLVLGAPLVLYLLRVQEAAPDRGASVSTPSGASVPMNGAPVAETNMNI